MSRHAIAWSLVALLLTALNPLVQAESQQASDPAPQPKAAAAPDQPEQAADDEKMAMADEDRPTNTDRPRVTPAQVTPIGESIAIADRLRDVVEIAQIDGAPAKQAFEWYATVTGIPLVINWKQLENEFITPDTPITIELRNIPAGALLSLMMEQLTTDQELLYEVTPWYVRIMTKNQANQRLVVRVYDIRDLLHDAPDFRDAPEFDLDQVLSNSGERGGNGGQGRSPFAQPQQPLDEIKTEQQKVEEIITLIEETIEPEVWRNLGGPATIRYYRGQLIVNAPLYVQQQIGTPAPSPATRTSGATARTRAATPVRYYKVQPAVRDASDVSGVRGGQRTEVSGVRIR